MIIKRRWLPQWQKTCHICGFRHPRGKIRTRIEDGEPQWFHWCSDPNDYEEIYGDTLP